MCFHYSLTQAVTAIEQQLDMEPSPPLPPVYHADAFVFPEQPVVLRAEGLHTRLIRWGLIPHWVKSREEADTLRTLTLNARAETVFDKPSFRASIAARRCLVPADGFFEWMEVSGKKYPHYISRKDRAVFALGGIWSAWTDPLTGEWIPTFSLLTTAANPMMARIHNRKQRMPVVVPPSRYAEWLSPALDQPAIRSFFAPYSDEPWQAHTVSRHLSARSAIRYAPEVIQPFTYPELALG